MRLPCRLAMVVEATGKMYAVNSSAAVISRQAFCIQQSWQQTYTRTPPMWMEVERSNIHIDRLYSVPQNSFPLPTGSIFSFATQGSALGKNYAGAIVILFCGTLLIYYQSALFVNDSRSKRH